MRGARLSHRLRSERGTEEQSETESRARESYGFTRESYRATWIKPSDESLNT